MNINLFICNYAGSDRISSLNTSQYFNGAFAVDDIDSHIHISPSAIPDKWFRIRLYHLHID
jgi:hypothetical protein